MFKKIIRLLLVIVFGLILYIPIVIFYSWFLLGIIMGIVTIISSTFEFIIDDNEEESNYNLTVIKGTFLYLCMIPVFPLMIYYYFIVDGSKTIKEIL